MTTPIDHSRANVLLTNDDGIDAKGLQTLRREIEPLCNLLVVAPMSEKSGTGCSLTLHREMAVEERTENGRVWGYAVDGNPVDCVKFTLQALPYFKPDLVLSGINHGNNIGNSVWYSGTVAATLEATMFGLKAMAVSLSHKKDPPLKFATAARVVRGLLPWLLTQNWKPRTFWNLNVPNLAFEDVRGIRCTHQGTSFFVDDIRLTREENGRRFYTNVGAHLETSPEPENSDDLALEEKWASLSLLQMDMTVELPPVAREALESDWNRMVFDRPALNKPGT